MIIIPATLEEMISKAPSMAEDIDRSYVLTYMPKVPLGEKHVDRYITVTSRRPDLVVHARRKLVLGKN